MSLKEELDGLRKSHDGVRDLVYADMSAGMVLYANSGETRSQEVYDRLFARAAQLLAEGGPAAKMGMSVGAAVRDAFILDSDGAGLRLFVRVEANAEECLIFGCHPGADVSAISRAAAETLTRFASSEE